MKIANLTDISRHKDIIEFYPIFLLLLKEIKRRKLLGNVSDLSQSSFELTFKKQIRDLTISKEKIFSLFEEHNITLLSNFIWSECKIVKGEKVAFFSFQDSSLEVTRQIVQKLIKLIYLSDNSDIREVVEFSNKIIIWYINKVLKDPEIVDLEKTEKIRSCWIIIGGFVKWMLSGKSYPVFSPWKKLFYLLIRKNNLLFLNYLTCLDSVEVPCSSTNCQECVFNENLSNLSCGEIFYNLQKKKCQNSSSLSLCGGKCLTCSTDQKKFFVKEEGIELGSAKINKIKRKVHELEFFNVNQLDVLCDEILARIIFSDFRQTKLFKISCNLFLETLKILSLEKIFLSYEITWKKKKKSLGKFQIYLDWLKVNRKILLSIDKTRKETVEYTTEAVCTKSGLSHVERAIGLNVATRRQPEIISYDRSTNLKIIKRESKISIETISNTEFQIQDFFSLLFNGNMYVKGNDQSITFESDNYDSSLISKLADFLFNYFFSWNGSDRRSLSKFLITEIIYKDCFLKGSEEHSEINFEDVRFVNFVNKEISGGILESKSNSFKKSRVLNDLFKKLYPFNYQEKLELLNNLKNDFISQFESGKLSSEDDGIYQGDLNFSLDTFLRSESSLSEILKLFHKIHLAIKLEDIFLTIRAKKILQDFPFVRYFLEKKVSLARNLPLMQHSFYNSSKFFKDLSLKELRVSILFFFKELDHGWTFLKLNDFFTKAFINFLNQDLKLRKVLISNLVSKFGNSILDKEIEISYLLNPANILFSEYFDLDLITFITEIVNTFEKDAEKVFEKDNYLTILDS